MPKRQSEDKAQEKPEKKLKKEDKFRIPKKPRRSLATQTHYGYCHTGTNLLFLVDMLLYSLTSFKARFAHEREIPQGIK